MQQVRKNLDLDIGVELQAMSAEDRSQMLKEVALPVKIPTNHVLAMKSNLSFSWNQWRVLQR